MEGHLDRNPVVSASEIKDFVYRPLSFYLKRAGIEDVEEEESDDVLKRGL